MADSSSSSAVIGRERRPASPPPVDDKRAEAVLEIVKDLGGLFFFSTLFSIFPTSLNNYMYDYIAKNRFKWYGKKETCLIPTKELQAKFLE